MPQPLSGIIPPLVTPLRDRDTLDHAGLERLIEHLISGGVSGLFVLGTTGEGPSLSYRLRKELVELRRIVLPMREVVNTLRRSDTDERDGWYDDLYDNVIRAAEWTESLRDMITAVFETNLSLQDARLNIVVKKLTGWAAIIAMPTLVTGWYGQNIPYPGFSEPSGVITSALLSVLTSLILYIMFKRRDWI